MYTCPCIFYNSVLFKVTSGVNSTSKCTFSQFDYTLILSPKLSFIIEVVELTSRTALEDIQP